MSSIKDQKSEASVSAAFDVLPHPVLIYNTEQTITRANKTAEDTFGINLIGLTETDLINKLNFTLLNGQKAKKQDMVSYKALFYNEEKEGYYEYTTLNGTIKHSVAKASIIYEEGEKSGTLVTWQDISQYRSLEDKLRASRRMFKDLIDTINDCICICSKDYSITYGNPAFYTLFPESKNQKCYKLIFGFSEPCTQCRYSTNTNNKNSWEWQDGNSGRIYNVTEFSLENTFDSPSHLIMFHEITEYKNRETHLKQNAEALENSIQEKARELYKATKILSHIFSESNMLIAYLDKDFNFLQVNNAYAKSGRKSVEYFYGKNHFDLYPDEENKAIFKSVVETGEGFSTYARPYTYPDQDSKEIHYWDWTLNPVKDEGGKVSGLILMILNVTQRVAAEKELRKKEKELHLSKRLSHIGKLAATITHELRNPLGVINTAAFNLRRKNKDPKLEKSINTIEKKVMESSLIIDNILTYTNIKKPKKKRVSIHNFLMDCINSAAMKYQEASTEIVTKIENVKHTYIMIDPFQIREVVNNAFTNAFEATPEAGGKIAVTAESCRIEDEECCSISITDNGCGIPKEILERVTEPFFTSKDNGTGLGLALCKELVENHEGELQIHSEEKKGTNITIVLPME
ncbi:MAG: ATP-binding protein [Spirochaetia bacterium]